MFFNSPLRYTNQNNHMKKIIIDPHNCSREEQQELIEYLNENSWDFKEETEEEENEVNYSLREDSIFSLLGSGTVIINDKIVDDELFGYKICERESIINDLMGWIPEAKSSDKHLMRQGLEYLLTLEDEYIFSSISTNEYVGTQDSNFNELCEELLELNKTMEE